MRITIIANPVAGGGKGRVRGEALRDALVARGHAAELLITTGPGDAVGMAAAAQGDCVVGVGGDGTVNEVLNGLRDPAQRLAALPVGTANVVARELRIPKRPEELAELIDRGDVRTLDTGFCNGRRFLQSAGSGFDAAVVREVHAGRGKRLSYAGYAGPIIRTLRTYTFPKITVHADGRLVCADAQYALVGNCVNSAGLFPLTPEAALDSGRLDLVAFRDLTLFRMARLAAASFRAGFAERPDVLYLQCSEATFAPAGADPVYLQIDGDPAGELPASIRVAPGSLRMVAPVPTPAK